jgi:hypothetical protein
LTNEAFSYIPYELVDHINASAIGSATTHASTQAGLVVAICIVVNIVIILITFF